MNVHHAKHRTHRIWVLLLLMPLLPSGCKKKADDANSDDKPIVSVQAEKVAIGSITETVQADSVLAPVAQAAIVSKISSPIKQFYVQRGMRVRAGQALATLENADLAANVTDTRGSLEQARAAYNTATKATVPEDLTTAQSNVDQAKAALDVQRQQTESRSKLFAEGAIPKRDYDTARAALVQAQGAYDTAAQHLAGLKRASSQATVQNAQGGLESAKGKFESAGAQLSYATIRSPIAGVVSDRPLFAGEMAQAGSPIITIIDTSFVLAKLHLPQEQVARLRVGNKATVQVQNTDDQRDGVVSLISPAADPGTTTIEVWVKVPNADSALRPGTAVHVSIEEHTLTNIETVPNEAIVTTKTGGSAVMVIGTDGIAHQRNVALGVSDGKDTQVLKGLAVGETVVTTGSQSLEDGTQVKVSAGDDEKEGDAGSSDKKDTAAGSGGGQTKGSGPNEGGDAGKATTDTPTEAPKNSQSQKPSGGKGSAGAAPGAANSNNGGGNTGGPGGGKN